MSASSLRHLLLCLYACSLSQLCSALTLDTSSASSIKDASSQVAYGMMKYYTGNNTGDNPGNLPSPYYWWEAGGMFMHLVDYWYYTGDTTYNAETVQAICWQGGKAGTFMPANQTMTEGNDDQAFWAFAAMAAAELNFVAPWDGYPSWLAMVQGAFNLMTTRWDTDTCGGGLRWQIFPENNGYNYKNVAANGGFFMLACRLARYTGNKTYVDWAEKSFTWFEDSILFDNSTYQINDGTDDTSNCSSADHTQWSYNYGMYLGGLAYLYNHTENEKWLAPLNGILNKTLTQFFPASSGDKIMVEVACEPFGTCSTDGFTFKSFTLRWLAVTTQLVPSVAATIWPYLQATGEGAAGQCDGGDDGITCGFKWTTSTWDGSYGVGQQMSALSAISANMLSVSNLKVPYTSDTGGTSKGDPTAGTTTGDQNPNESKVLSRKITTSDKAGAGILTALALVFTLGGAWFLVS